jgi:hypothetical protein
MHLYCTLVGRAWSPLYTYSPPGLAGRTKTEAGAARLVV